MNGRQCLLCCMSSFHQNSAQFVDNLRKLVVENRISPNNNLLHVDEMISDNARYVFNGSCSEKKFKTCSKENADYGSRK
jgi:hypothetical protein